MLLYRDKELLTFPSSIKYLLNALGQLQFLHPQYSLCDVVNFDTNSY